MYSTITSAFIDGISSRKVTVETDVSDGLPMFTMVGFLASETKEASERVRSALRNSGIFLGVRHITVNLAPASQHKGGSLFDLAIAVSVLSAYGFFPQKALDGILFLGEHKCSEHPLLKVEEHDAPRPKIGTLAVRVIIKTLSVIYLFCHQLFIR